MLFSEKDEKRKASRAPISTSVELQTIGLEEIVGSLAQDISPTGLRLVVNDFMPVNSQLNLHVELAPGHYADCLGRVMWVKQIPHSDRYEIGVKFEWFDPAYDAKNRISRYVTQNV